MTAAIRSWEVRVPEILPFLTFRTRRQETFSLDFLHIHLWISHPPVHLPLHKLERRAFLKGESLFLRIMDQPHGLWPARTLCGPQRDVCVVFSLVQVVITVTADR